MASGDGREEGKSRDGPAFPGRNLQLIADLEEKFKNAPCRYIPKTQELPLDLNLRLGPANGQADQRQLASSSQGQQFGRGFEPSFAISNHVYTLGRRDRNPLFPDCFLLSAARGPGAGIPGFKLKNRGRGHPAARNQNVAPSTGMKISPEKRNITRFHQDEDLHVQ